MFNDRILSEILSTLRQQEITLQRIAGTLQSINKLLTPKPTGFKVTLKGAKTMPAVKAVVDFQLIDSGTAKAVATPTDALGVAESLPAGSSAPSWAVTDASGNPTPFLSLAPDASDPSGLTQIVTVSLSDPIPSPLPSGLLVTVSASLPDGTVIKGSSQPVDIVPGPVSGFSMSLQ